MTAGTTSDLSDPSVLVGSSKSYEIRPAKSFSDSATTAAIFEIYCFFADPQHLREQVKSVWTDYRAGKLDISVAYIVSKVAIDVVISAEDTLLQAKPIAAMCKDKEDVWQVFSSCLHRVSPYATSASANTDTDEEHDRLVMTYTARILKQTMHACSYLGEHGWPLPIAVPPAPNRDADSENRSHKRGIILGWILHDLLLVEELLPEGYRESPTYSRQADTLRSYDPVSCGLRDVWESRRLRPSHVFTAELALDIVLQLRAEGDRKLEDDGRRAIHSVTRAARCHFDEESHLANYMRSIASTLFSESPIARRLSMIWRTRRTIL